MLYIICDCSQATELCVKRSSAITRPELEYSLSDIKVSVTIAWIPGDQEIQFNDIADDSRSRDIYIGSYLPYI